MVALYCPELDTFYFYFYSETTANGTVMIDPYDAGIDVMDLTHSHRRSRRSIWDGLKFRLEAPSVDWQKLIGSKSIGASFGVIMMNLLDLVVGKWLFYSVLISLLLVYMYGLSQNS